MMKTKLALYMDKHALSIQDVARIVGVTPSGVSGWLKQGIARKTISARIAEAFFEEDANMFVDTHRTLNLLRDYE